MAYRPLHRKITEAIYLIMNRSHLSLSVGLLSLLLVPMVFMMQLVALALSTNIPGPYALAGLLIAGSVIEETAKSISVGVLIEKRIIHSLRDVLVLSFLSAFGFLVGEKLLLYMSLSVVSETPFSEALFSSGMILVPLVAHFIFTSMVGLFTKRFGFRYYPLAILIGSAAHALYNLAVVAGGLR